MGYRALVPFLRRYGTTRFLSRETPRNGLCHGGFDKWTYGKDPTQSPTRDDVLELLTMLRVGLRAFGTTSLLSSHSESAYAHEC